MRVQHTDIQTYIHTYIQTYIHTDRQTEPNYDIDSVSNGGSEGSIRGLFFLNQ